EGEADNEVGDCKDGEHLDRTYEQLAVQLRRSVSELVDRNDVAKRSLLDQRNELSDQRCKRVVEGLRQDAECQRAEISGPDRTSRLFPTTCQCLNAGTDAFPEIRPFIKHKSADDGSEAAQRAANQDRQREIAPDDHPQKRDSKEGGED